MGTGPRTLCAFGLLSLLLVLQATVNALTRGENCRNPDELEGECIPITTCELYVQMIKEKPLTEERKKSLQRAQCGVQGKVPLVCCPFPVRTTDAGEVSEHPNWKDLPSDTCGGEHSDSIFNTESGEVARITKFSNVALLKYETSEGPRFLCGGTVISARYILTAAHCVVMGDGKKLTAVRLGEHDLESDPDCEKDAEYEECNDPIQEMDIEEVIPHPQYQSSGGRRRNDIALIRLATAAKLTDNVVPVCLPNGNSLANAGADAPLFVVGWQKAENGHINSVKMQATLTATTDKDCSPMPGGKLTLEENQMCAKGPGQGTCRGDSGGPLMAMNQGARNRLGIYATCVGILSMRSTDCTNEDIPSVYTLVAPYMNWILDSVKP